MRNPLNRRIGNASDVTNKKSWTKGSTMTKAGIGGVALDGYLNMKSGDDPGTAAVKAVGTGMLWATAPLMMGAHLGATSVVGGHKAYTQWHRKKEDQWNQQFYKGQVGGNYQDTRRAMTMRQAAVQQIQGSKLNARSALGGEAKLLARRGSYG